MPGTVLGTRDVRVHRTRAWTEVGCVWGVTEHFLSQCHLGWMREERGGHPRHREQRGPEIDDKRECRTLRGFQIGQKIGWMAREDARKGLRR